MAKSSAALTRRAPLDNAKQLQEEALDHVWIHSQQYARLAQDGVLVMVKGEGCILWDVDGNPYFDAYSGLGAVHVGYSRPEIAEAIAGQVRQISFANGLAYTSPPTIQLAEKLVTLLPGNMSRVFFCSGGSEANESAMKVAKQYQVLRGQARRFKVIGRLGSYHGATYGAMSVTGSRPQTYRYFEPMVPGALHAPGHYCYRCHFGMSYPACDLRCARAVEQLIQLHAEDTVAAFIGEAVPAEQGVVVAPPEYWPMVRETCSRYGIVLIADEVMTGFGRTGRMFACEHFGLVPDMITVAKGISGGYAPLAAVATKPSIAEAFVGEDAKTLQHVFTYAGHPPSCAAGLKTIEIIERENLVDNSRRIGERLLHGFETLRDHPVVGEVRGLGLLLGIELVLDKKTRTPITGEDAHLIAMYLRREGVLANVDRVLRVKPPLIITAEQADWLVETVDRVLGRFEKERGLA